MFLNTQEKHWPVHNSLYVTLLTILHTSPLQHFTSPLFCFRSMASPLQLHPFLFLLPLFSPTPSLSTNSEGAALHAMRTKLSDHSNVLQSWDPTLVNPCTWFHVTCDSNDHVARLDLENANITGQLGSELGQLRHLKHLELYGNNLGGKIPEELGNLEELVSMDLYGNRLHGGIPRSFGKLRSLKFL